MATNEILPFATTNTGTNLLTQAEYVADAERVTGHQPGIARSKLENKALRQSSLIASGVAQFIATYQANNVTDSLTPQQVADYLLAAVQFQIPSGLIVMWSGTIATIPTGWKLCDGSAGTPDLRDRFIIGARQDSSGEARTNVTGALTKTGGSKDATLVSHNHTGTTGGQSQAHSHDFSGTSTSAGNHAHTGSTDTQGTHSHIVNDPGHFHTSMPDLFSGGGSGSAMGVAGATIANPSLRSTFVATTGVWLNSDGAHSHNVSTNTTGAHTHGYSGTTTTQSQDHAHSYTTSTQGSSGTNANLVPYFALAFIMKG